MNNFPKPHLLVIFLFTLLSTSLIFGQVTTSAIIQQSIETHDPGGRWDSLDFEFHVEEPRIPNPVRYSIVHLDNNSAAFKLRRNHGEHEITYVVDQYGNHKALLDGKEEKDAELIEQYRLHPERAGRFEKFYRFYYGLPMSLEKGLVMNAQVKSVEVFDRDSCYKISLELSEPLISKYWNIYISTRTLSVRGVEIVFPEDPSKGERIVFDSSFYQEGVLFPRIRSWYGLMEGEYLGSDLIMH